MLADRDRFKLQIKNLNISGDCLDKKIVTVTEHGFLKLEMTTVRKLPRLVIEGQKFYFFFHIYLYFNSNQRFLLRI